MCRSVWCEDPPACRRQAQREWKGCKVFYEIRRDSLREGPGKWTVWRRQFVRDPWVCIDDQCCRRVEAREVVRMWRGRDAAQDGAIGILARAWLGVRP